MFHIYPLSFLGGTAAILPWVILGLVLIAGLILLSVIASKRRQVEETDLPDPNVLLKEHLEQLSKRQEDTRQQLRGDLMVPNLIIDNPLWLSVSAQRLFDFLKTECAHGSWTFVLCHAQFDALCSMRDSVSSRQVQEDARRALRRIADLQEAGVLEVEINDGSHPTLKPEEVVSGADCTALLGYFAANGKELCFISDDSESRIRASAFLKQTGVTFKVVGAFKVFEAAGVFFKSTQDLEKVRERMAETDEANALSEA